MEKFQKEIQRLCKTLNIENKWTVLAAIGIINNKTEFSKLVCLATGVKCLPDSKIDENPLFYVHDSHAEVLCRRGLVKYLIDGGACSDDEEFVMYISHVPCGDASMHLFKEQIEGVRENDKESELDRENDKESDSDSYEFLTDNYSKKRKVLRGREDWSISGALRTKPGRADSPETSCMSCSDKICLWNVIGWQGSLIDKPVFIRHIIIDHGFDEIALKRSFSRFVSEPITFYKASVSLSFTNLPTDSPSFESVVWVNGKKEKIVGGLKQGAGKRISPKVCSMLSRCKLSGLTDIKVYYETKYKNARYQELKTYLFENSNFKGWKQRIKAKEFQIGSPIATQFSRTIVGGTEVSPKFKYPWLVSIKYNGKHTCGGTIIGATWLMTAAHCTVPFTSSQYKSHLTVEAHRHDITSSVSSESGFLFTVKQLIVHPDYNPQTFVNDVAVWELIPASGQESFSDFAFQIGGADLDIAGSNTMVAGWGTLSYGSTTPSSVMLQVNVPVKAELYCRLAYGDDFNPSMQLCAGSAGKDSCQGDSGGPLFILDMEGASPRYVIVGVVSNGYGCGFQGYPGLYTRITPYVKWINDQTGLNLVLNK